jgi:hypothetical protein
MKEEEIQSSSQPQVQPLTEAHPDSADRSIHQYDPIDLH